MPLSRPALDPRTRRIVAGLAVAAVAAGGTLLAIGARQPAAKAVWAEAAPVAVARAADAGTTATASSSRDAGPAKSFVAGVRLASYNAKAGTALLATGSSGTTVRTGDVIASPPNAAAPKGALFTVGKVKTTDRGIQVSTEPATLSDALGAAEVNRTFPAKDLTMSVTPLATGVRSVAKVPSLTGAATGTGATTAPTTPSDPASPTPATPTPGASSTPARASTPSPSGSAGPGGAANPAASTPSIADTRVATPATETLLPGLAVGGTTILNPARTADGGVMLSLDIPLAGVAGVTGTSQGGPKLAGWVGLTPKLIFSYGRKNVDGAKPFQAEIGVGGKYTYGWQMHAALAGLADTGERALRLPFAEVHVNQTFWIGPVPVVISADLTYFYRLTAQGTLSIDSEQTTAGEFAVGASYDSRTGWGPLNRNQATTSGDAMPVVTGRGDLRATVGADLAVFLYDAAGVTGRLAPYLRAAVDGSLDQVRWGLYAGIDVTATLTLQLKIFGITILRADLPVPPLHAEWKVAASAPEPATAG